jgi:hypothetical protein
MGFLLRNDSSRSKVEYFLFVQFILNCMATTANRIVKRNESDHGCVGGSGTVANIGAGEYSLLDIMYDTIKLIPQSYKTFATTLSLIFSA